MSCHSLRLFGHNANENTLLPRVFPRESRGLLLDEPGFLQSLECAVLLDRTETTGRDGDADALLELRDIDRLLLEIGVATDLAARVELCGTGAVRIAATAH